jgi:hypothetical protein
VGDHPAEYQVLGLNSVEEVLRYSHTTWIFPEAGSLVVVARDLPDALQRTWSNLYPLSQAYDLQTHSTHSHSSSSRLMERVAKMGFLRQKKRIRKW